jgi:hypothetical protein
VNNAVRFHALGRDQRRNFGFRRGIYSAQQVAQFEAAVFAAGLQRGHDAGDDAALGKRQQQALIGHRSAGLVLDLQDHVDGKLPALAFGAGGQQHRNEIRRDVVVDELAASRRAECAGEKIAVVVDAEANAAVVLPDDGVEDDLIVLVLKAFDVKVRRRRRGVDGGKLQPAVEQRTLADVPHN